MLAWFRAAGPLVAADQGLSRGQLLLEIDDLCQQSRRWSLEQGSEGQADAEGFADPAEEADGEEGVAAYRKEIVVPADRVAFEDLAPEGAELAFYGRGRIEHRGQLGNGRGVEQLAEGEADPEGLAEPAEEPDGEKRVAA